MVVAGMDDVNTRKRLKGERKIWVKEDCNTK